MVMSWWLRHWLALWSLSVASLARRQPTPVVHISSGALRGTIARDGSHAAYNGIPYATITHRFQAPGPEPRWDGVFEATNDRVHCTQTLTLSSKITIGQKDCLILNVYTPLQTPLDKPLPVMVYIHGGAFFRRSSSGFVYGPKYLVNKGIILVTMNYRLHAQGFLCLGTKEAPGNAGLKDQVAALKWVQKNIRSFGGDPHSVTLVGESAGAASVSMHVLSPMSKGLFHRAIEQSGSSLSGWAFEYDPIDLASSHAKEMGFVSRDPYELYKFYMSKSDSDIVATKLPRKEGTTIVQSEISFAPCAELDIPGEEPFLTDLPYNIFISGKYNKVPMIIGSNSEEGLLFAGVDKKLEEVSFEKALPKDLEFPSKEMRKEIAKKVKKLYLGDNEVSLKVVRQLSRFYGEPYNNYGPVQETSLIVNTSVEPVWHYLFGYSGFRNLLKIPLSLELQRVSGATHGDELFYIFSQDIVPSLFETDMIEKMTTMWTNFIKYGDPTPTTSRLLPVKWLPVNQEDPKALYITQDMKTIPLWYTDALLFWRDLYSKYRKKYYNNSTLH